MWWRRLAFGGWTELGIRSTWGVSEWHLGDSMPPRVDQKKHACCMQTAWLTNRMWVLEAIPDTFNKPGLWIVIMHGFDVCIPKHTDEEKKQLIPSVDTPIMIEQTSCLGSELKLTDCDFHFTIAYSCSLHENDVTLTCLGRWKLMACETKACHCWPLILLKTARNTNLVSSLSHQLTCSDHKLSRQ